MQAISINERVEKIKDKGSAIDDFINEYKPFISSCVQKNIGRFVRYGVDDELSIGLMAFSEAIHSYTMAKGSFLSFAQTVIKRRLIDYYRKEKKHDNVVSISDYKNEDGEEVDLTEHTSVTIYNENEISEYRRLELIQFKEELKEWDISFYDLADVSPKQDKTRKIYADIIKFILSEPEIAKNIKQKKYLPILEIEKKMKVPRKTIERARKYIIAAVIIKLGDYQYVNSFVNWG